jgi:hypothetical protein
MMDHTTHKIITSSESERDKSGGSDKTPNEHQAALKFTFLKSPKLQTKPKIISSFFLPDFDKKILWPISL